LPIEENPLREQRLSRMKGHSSNDLSQLKQTPRWQQLSTLFTDYHNA